ncbi:hypothetical protein [Novosphingobium sp. SG707]|uniref:hypothetical protein n=1 Tax=Novosphingobium sp. SG707 TaxID=2586996 RepID=UPI001444EB65|nr:hypothetical protein [Novosphingobium sp. SG707]NKJ02983.1 hypothetical protein [Novosphingobium sp. SG707]
MLHRFFGLLAGAAIATASTSVNAAPFTGIYVLTASSGKIGGHQHFDITSRLQDLCGNQGNTCDIWCSQTTFGGRELGRHSVCRAIYRCPDGATRSTEAGREEPILMRCLASEADDRQASAVTR